MFDKYEVIRRLYNGETLDEIADSMTDALNEAVHEYEKEKKDRKLDDMQEILDLIRDFCIKYYTETEEEKERLLNIFDDEKLVKEVVDGIEESAKAIAEFTESFENIKKVVKKKPEKKKCHKKTKSVNEMTDEEKRHELEELSKLPNVYTLNINDDDVQEKLSSMLTEFASKP